MRSPGDLRRCGHLTAHRREVPSPVGVSRGEGNGTRVEQRGDGWETESRHRRRMAAPTRPTRTTTAQNTVPPPPSRRRGRWIEYGRPEDLQFWESPGRKAARRNLLFS